MGLYPLSHLQEAPASASGEAAGLLGHESPSLTSNMCRSVADAMPILALVFLEAVLLWLLWSDAGGKPLFILFQVTSWILGLAIHEFAHALIGFLGGDTTVANKGYLTMNIFKYMDLSLSLVVPLLFLLLGGIGLPGGSVMIAVVRRKLTSPRSTHSLQQFQCCTDVWTFDTHLKLRAYH